MPVRRSSLPPAGRRQTRNALCRSSVSNGNRISAGSALPRLPPATISAISRRRRRRFIERAYTPTPCSSNPRPECPRKRERGARSAEGVHSKDTLPARNCCVFFMRRAGARGEASRAECRLAPGDFSRELDFCETLLCGSRPA